MQKISSRKILRALACAVLFLGLASCKGLNPLTWTPLHVVASGTKPWVAEYQGTIYVVFVNDRKIWLVTSRDGMSWTSPQRVSGTDVASDPAIIMTANGTRVITWRAAKSGGVYSLRYSFENGCLSQSGLATLNDYVVSYDITKTDDQIHLVADAELGIRYASFPANAPTESHETIETLSMCTEATYIKRPAIAARSTPKGPEVVVAYYRYSNEPHTCGPGTPIPRLAGPRVVKRTPPNKLDGYQWDGFFGLMTPIEKDSSLVTTTEPYSLSLDVDSSGTYFLAASDIVNSVSRVILARGKTTSSSWAENTTTYAVDRANNPPKQVKAVSVAAKRNQPGYFNLAYTWHHAQPLPPLPPQNDETYREVVEWPLSNSAPVASGTELLDSLGNNARAADIRVCYGANLCVLSTIFERRIGNNSEIVSDAMCTWNYDCAYVRHNVTNTTPACLLMR